MKNILVPVNHKHAKTLFPMITNKVTATIQWDGPNSFEDYERGLKEREDAHIRKEIFLFTIIHPKTKEPIGSIDIRPDENMFRASVGLWIGEEYHGRGLGTMALKAITDFGFRELKLTKIEGYIFEGNIGSQRIFEKCGYFLEGTIRSRIVKQSKAIDEWVYGILRNEWSL